MMSIAQGMQHALHRVVGLPVIVERRCRRHSANVAGIVVHDHWKPYYTMQGVLHALCNAHHLRELKALVEIEKEAWAGKMQRLLRRACHVANKAREQGVPLKSQLIECCERRYDALSPRGSPSMRPKCRWREPR